MSPASWSRQIYCGFLCGVVSMLIFSLPRLEITRHGMVSQTSYTLTQIPWPALWAGVLASSQGLALRSWSLGGLLFVAGWGVTGAFMLLSRSASPLQWSLQYVVSVWLDLPSRHMAYQLDRFVFLTEAIVPVTLVTVVRCRAVGQTLGRTAGAALIAAALCPVLYLLSALVQTVFTPPWELTHAVNFLLLLVHFGGWGVAPWLIPSRAAATTGDAPGPQT